MLSDRDITYELAMGKLVIQQYKLERLQPASYDVALALGYIFEDEKHDTTHFLLEPHKFVLASIEEWIEIPDYLACRIEGKSSLGRRGLLVHATAGFVDPGFRGNLTLEIANLSHKSIVLHQGMLVAQLSFYRLTSTARRPYGHPELGSRYQDSVGVLP